jgi:hypothetical protein
MARGGARRGHLFVGAANRLLRRAGRRANGRRYSLAARIRRQVASSDSNAAAGEPGRRTGAVVCAGCGRVPAAGAAFRLNVARGGHRYGERARDRGHTAGRRVPGAAPVRILARWRQLCVPMRRQWRAAETGLPQQPVPRPRRWPVGRDRRAARAIRRVRFVPAKRDPVEPRRTANRISEAQSRRRARRRCVPPGSEDPRVDARHHQRWPRAMGSGRVVAGRHALPHPAALGRVRNGFGVVGVRRFNRRITGPGAEPGDTREDPAVRMVARWPRSHARRDRRDRALRRRHACRRGNWWRRSEDHGRPDRRQLGARMVTGRPLDRRDVGCTRPGHGEFPVSGLRRAGQWWRGARSSRGGGGQHRASLGAGQQPHCAARDAPWPHGDRGDEHKGGRCR